MSEAAETVPSVLTPKGMPAVLELLKPITWFAPMWAFGCGVVSSGASILEKWPLVVTGVLLCGPLVCGTSQAVNDWFDRHVDAINEPGRPIPSGRMPGERGLHIAMAGTLISLVVAIGLGAWAFLATMFGLCFAWAYSAPPLRLKLNGWWGNAACGACYEGLPWITGTAILTAAQPSWGVFAMAGLYSIGAHGIMTLNDFKSVDGDRKMGIGSLPVRLGVDNAAKTACLVMALPQIVVCVLLFSMGFLWHGGAVSLLLLAQLLLMARLLGNPFKLAPWYNATGTSLYVIGMLVAAFSLRPGAGS